MNKAIIIAGPTASGKTSLAIDICKKFGGEVVSADSMQIYKGMDIATAKPTAQEMDGIVHHLIDIVDPSEPFSVSQFKSMADTAIKDIVSRGKIPVIAGGTGLYIDSLINNTEFGEFSEDENYRAELNRRAELSGGQVLLDELAGVDPECAARLHANDIKRIIRGLEFYHCTGKTLTQNEKESRVKKSEYEYLILGLFFEDREKLYQRINLRVDKMLEAGLEQEARNALKVADSPTAYQAIGYKELKPYFDGVITLEQAVESLKKSTRNYAKRQLTWFRRYENMVRLYVDKGDLQDAEQIVRSFLK
ncbi:MAG: tRNA (adenosine(37)-N6)-dimethylallyltransferase MiaA [Ruminococcaceae bacterium]|nr:tRNA (adenosine(37)-N6)-dimethylallyltransferase MiaA [Oscillospiraceae bacterium]